MRYCNRDSRQNRRRFRKKSSLNLSRQLEVTLHFFFLDVLTVQLGLLERQRHVGGERVEERLVFLVERLGLIQQLQDADDGVGFIADGQAKQLLCLEAQLPINVRFETRIAISVIEAHRGTLARHPAGNAPVRGEADHMLLQTQADQGPYFVVFLVHEKNSAASRAGLAGGQVQNDVNQLTKIECRIQPFGGLDDAGEFLHCAAAFRQRQRESRETGEQIELATHRIPQRFGSANLQNAHAKLVAAQ